MPLIPVEAPAVPAAAITGALILVVAAWIALYGLKYGYDYSLGALLRKLADSTRGIRWIGGRIASTFDDIDSWIQEQIADGIDSLEKTAARLWDALAWLVRETGDALVAFGHDVHDAIDGLVHGEIPAQVHSVTHPITIRVSRTSVASDTRWRAEAQARSRGIDELNRDLTKEQLARERGIDRINDRLQDLVIPRIKALDQAIDDVVGFTRRNLRVRVGRVEQALAAGTIGAIAVAALTRVFPWWQCTNVRAFNRTLCRLPIGALDDLLGLALLAVVSLNLDEFIEDMQAATGFVSGAIDDWIVR